MTTAYLDASALVKIVTDEHGSPAVRRYLAGTDRAITSRIGIVETVRAVRRRAPVEPSAARHVLQGIQVIELTPAIEDAASRLGLVGLRTLDAIHLASALVLGPDLDAFVTYDQRLTEAAAAAGLPVVAPA